MSYRYLTREEMVSITTTLVQPSHADYRVIHAHALAGALWVLIADAHVKLLSTQPNGPTATRLVEIRDELAALSRRHGDVLRGIYHGLMAQEYLARDESTRVLARKLRVKMFPEKLQATRKSYRGQEGQALLLQSRLTDDDIEALRRLSTLEGLSFADAVDEWLAIAKQIGQLDNERTGDSQRVITAADVSAARNDWIRAVRTFVSTLRMRPDVTGELAVILDRIENMGRRADQRRGRARHEEPEDMEAAKLPEPGLPPAPEGEASHGSAELPMEPATGPRTPDAASTADRRTRGGPPAREVQAGAPPGRGPGRSCTAA